MQLKVDPGVCVCTRRCTTANFRDVSRSDTPLHLHAFRDSLISKSPLLTEQKALVVRAEGFVELCQLMFSVIVIFAFITVIWLQNYTHCCLMKFFRIHMKQIHM